MHMMNQFGNGMQRGFGGPPQPQRQGGRRGNRGGGGFRGNSRFEHNQNQRNPNQGGQRPTNEPPKQPPIADKPQQQTVPAQQNPQPQQQPKPQQQNQPQNPPQNQQQKPAQTPPAQLAKSAAATPLKVESKDNVDKAVDVKNQGQNFQGNQSQNKPAFLGTQIQNKPAFQGNQNQNKPAFQGNQNKPGFQGNQNKPGFQGNQNQNEASFQGNDNQNKPAFQGNDNQNKPGFQGNRNQNQNRGGFQGNQGQGNQGQGNQGQGNQGQGFQGNQNKGFQGNQQKNVNGNFGGNKGGWQGGQGNNQGGNNQGGNYQGNKPFNRQGNQGGGNQGPQDGPARNQQRGGPGNRPGLGGPDGAKREEHMLANKLKDLMGPILDLPPLEQPEVKFNGRSRLYIGNLANDISEEDILKMFGAFGETAELFLNKEKNFGFIKLDYRVNAERAKRELDGQMKGNKTLRVRFAPHNSAVRVKNLPPFVSNELLYRAFEIFGKIERAYVRVDERGKTLGEGVVEYARKPSALAAIRNCTEKCFFLTSSLRPVIVENFEEPDEFDGYPEKNLPKKHPEFLKAREVGPRFSELNSFEHEYGTRWKQLHELHRQKEEALKKELAAEEEKLEAQMEYAKYEHETELLREQLRQREQDRERQKRSWEMAERAADERRDTERAQLLRQEEELSQRMRHQDDELRRRQQENTLFVQAQRLNSMLDRQEQGMFDQQQPMDGGFRDQYDMPRGSFDDMPQGRGWDRSQMDDYPNKRRRF